MSWQWFTARTRPLPRYILHKYRMRLSHSQSSTPARTGMIPSRKQKGTVWPFQKRTSGQNWSLNSLRMDITTEKRPLFDNHPRRKNKVVLLDITIVNPCASSHLENEARHAGNQLADADERKINTCRGPFPAS